MEYQKVINLLDKTTNQHLNLEQKYVLKQIMTCVEHVTSNN